MGPFWLAAVVRVAVEPVTLNVPVLKVFPSIVAGFFATVGLSVMVSPLILDAPLWAVERRAGRGTQLIGGCGVLILRQRITRLVAVDADEAVVAVCEDIQARLGFCLSCRLAPVCRDLRIF